MTLEELRSLIDLHYDIGIIKNFSSLTGGYWNQILKLETDRGDFVLRISPPRAKPESVVYQHELLKFMHARISEVPLPLSGKDSSTFFIFNGRVIVLFPFLKGKMASRTVPEQQISAARMLAQLHRAGLEFPDNISNHKHSSLMDFNWHENNNWRWSEIKRLLEQGTEALKSRLTSPVSKEAFGCIEEIVSRRKQIEDEWKAAQEWIAELKASNHKLILGVTHGDYYPSNLLVVNNEVSAVLDWDECGKQWLAYDLARALWEFCRYDGRAVMNRENAGNFLQAYREAGGVPTTELNLLIQFIRCVRLEEVLFSLGEALREEWWEMEYTLYNLEAIDNIQNGNIFV